MYNANTSYEENYRRGPQAEFVRQKSFPRILFLEAPRFSFLGVPLHLPFGVPAGPLLNAAFVKVALEAGYCLPVYKTVRTRAWESHPAPNVLSVKAKGSSLSSEASLESVVGEPFAAADYQSPAGLSITNSFGVPSQPPAVWQKDFETLAPFSAQHNPQQPGYHAMLSFQGSRLPEDQTAAGSASPTASATVSASVLFDAFALDSANAAVLAAAAASRTGFGILEINLSCPNEKGDPIYKNVEQAAALVRIVKTALTGFLNVKLVAKIGVLSESDCYKFVKLTQADLNGVSAINTVPARILSAQGKPVLGAGTEVGGVCGSLILKQGVEMISRLALARKSLGLDPASFGLIGVGGVASAKDYLLYKQAGADVVQAATGAMWNANLALEIAEVCNVPFQKFQTSRTS